MIYSGYVFDDKSATVAFGGILNISLKLDFYEKHNKAIEKSLHGRLNYFTDIKICFSNDYYVDEYISFFSGHILTCKLNQLVLFNIDSIRFSEYEAVFVIEGIQYFTNPINILATPDPKFHSLSTGIINYYDRVPFTSQLMVYKIKKSLKHLHDIKLFLCSIPFSKVICKINSKKSAIKKVSFENITAKYRKGIITVEGEMSQMMYSTVGIQISDSNSNKKMIIAKSSLLYLPLMSFKYCTPEYVVFNIPAKVKFLKIFVSEQKKYLNSPDIFGFPFSNVYYISKNTSFSQFSNSKAFFSEKKSSSYILIIFIMPNNSYRSEIIFDTIITINYSDCVSSNNNVLTNKPLQMEEKLSFSSTMNSKHNKISQRENFKISSALILTNLGVSFIVTSSIIIGIYILLWIKRAYKQKIKLHFDKKDCNVRIE